MNKNSRSLSTIQRQALAKVMDGRYELLVREAEASEQALLDELEGKVREELGVDVIDGKIEELETKREQLGFRSYGALIDGSKAQRLVQARSRDIRKVIPALEQERSDKLSRLWTAQTVEEAEGLLRGIQKAS